MEPAGSSDGVGRRLVMLEAAKEVPYCVGVFGSALLTDHVDAAEAFIFLAGTNLGAASYETVLAHLTHRGLAWKTRRGTTARRLDSTRSTRDTNLTVAAAIGRGRTELAVFDSLLGAVGAANFNLVRLSW